MNGTEEKYTKYALCREMLETVDIVKNFDTRCADKFVEDMDKNKPVFLSGEGSSRLFPAKRAIYEANRAGKAGTIFTDGSTQGEEYDLSGCTVFGASNSGQTKEVIRLFEKLKKEGHESFYGVTAFKDTKLEAVSRKTRVLDCGPEDAVAATKSVAEQALFYQAVFAALDGQKLTGLEEAAAAVEVALTGTVPDEIFRAMADAEMICFAGRNNGVAEELALKTNETTRKKSAYFEGTYAAHGVEEVLTDKDVLVIIDPFPAEEEKIKECLVDGVGMKVFAVADRETLFPTFRIPSAGDYRNYVELAAGWNLLAETGLTLGIDLDHPTRARKVGNEYEG